MSYCNSNYEEVKATYDPHCARDALDRRADAMVRAFSAGSTLFEIGREWGISRERVRQIIKRKSGLVGKDGGYAKRTKAARKIRIDNAELTCMRKYGCTVEQIRDLRAIGRRMVAAGKSYLTTPTRAFVRQRSNAYRDGYTWGMTLWEWWCVWRDSGLWEERGHTCWMVRVDKSGPFSAGNVVIKRCGGKEDSGGVKKQGGAAPLYVQEVSPGFVESVEGGHSGRA